MTPPSIWELAPHTKAKHAILRKYLDAWLPVITRYNDRVIICDGFAGPGVYNKGEKGSPVIAIEAFTEHPYKQDMNAQIRYIFIEAKKNRYESLKNIINQLEKPESVSCTILNDRYDKAFTKILDYLDEKDRKIAPTFAFIDPFGIKGIPLEIIDRLMAHPSCEVFITFMLGPLQRFVMSPEFEVHNDALFGCNEWRTAETLSGAERESFLRGLYQKQLEKKVGAKYVRYFTMRDRKERTIYDLFFATNHFKGIDLMKDAMWKVDQNGAFSFSDATDPNQETLFSVSPNWDQLYAILHQKFPGRTENWSVVEETIRRTPFRILKQQLNRDAKRDDTKFEFINSLGVRRGTINDDTLVRFEI